MVKSCSPFGLSGVVENSFPRSGGRACASVEAPEAPGIWPGKLPDAAQAGVAMRLEWPLKGSSISNHQLCGRAQGLHKVGPSKLTNVGLILVKIGGIK